MRESSKSTGEKGIEKSELVGEMGNNTRVRKEGVMGGKVEKGKRAGGPPVVGFVKGERCLRRGKYKEGRVDMVKRKGEKYLREGEG